MLLYKEEDIEIEDDELDDEDEEEINKVNIPELDEEIFNDGETKAASVDLF